MSDKREETQEPKREGETGGPADYIDLDRLRIRHEVHHIGVHTNAITSLAVTPNGQRLVTASGDGTARLWDLATGQCLKVFKEDTDWVHAVAVTPDGQWLITGCSDKTARLWDLETGRPLRVFAGHTGRVNAVAITPDGKRLVTGSSDKTARIWDMKTGHCMALLSGHIGSITTLAVTPDGRRVVTGSSDGPARLWDMALNRLLRVFAGHAGRIEAVAVPPDGKHLATASNPILGDDTVRLWDMETGRCIRVFEHEGAIAVLTPHDKLITLGRDYTIRFRDLKTGELLVTMYPVEEGFLWTTPPTKNAPSGWLWTDRFDLISVVQCDVEDGANPVPLPPDDPRREAYLTWVNDQKMVMDRLRLSWEEIQALEENRKKFLEGLQSGGTSIDVLLGPSKEGER